MTEMRMKHWVAALGLAAVCTCSVAAHASTLPPSGSPSLSQLGFVAGSDSVVYELTTAGAGTFHVDLSDFDWPSKLATLDFSATTASSVLDTLSGPGSATFEVGSAGTYYAHVTAQAQGNFDVGLYGLRIDFTPVSLPGAAWLFVSGLAVVAAMRRKRALLSLAAPAT